jgi:hypothetical protein
MPCVGKRAAIYLLIVPKGLLTNVTRRVAAMPEQGLPSSRREPPALEQDVYTRSTPTLVRKEAELLLIVLDERNRVTAAETGIAEVCRSAILFPGSLL